MPQTAAPLLASLVLAEENRQQLLKRVLQDARSQPVPEVHPQQEAVTARLEALRHRSEAAAALPGAAASPGTAQQNGAALPGAAGPATDAGPARDAAAPHADSQPISAATPSVPPPRIMQPLWLQHLQQQEGGDEEAKLAQAAPAPPRLAAQGVPPEPPAGQDAADAFQQQHGDLTPNAHGAAASQPGGANEVSMLLAAPSVPDGAGAPAQQRP